jgi:hypothetical protein
LREHAIGMSEAAGRPLLEFGGIGRVEIDSDHRL